MIVERVEHPTWLSNAYLVADGTAATASSSTPTASKAAARRSSTQRGIEITHVLVTHGDMRPRRRASSERSARAVAHADVVRCRELATARRRSGALEIRALATPGHCARPSRAPRQRHRLLTGRLPLQGHGRRHRARRARRLREPGRLDHGQLMALPPRRASIPATAAVDDRRRVGAKPVHPHLARRRRGGHRAVPRARARTRRCPLGPDYDGGHKALGALPRRPRRDRRREPGRTRLKLVAIRSPERRGRSPAPRRMPLWQGRSRCRPAP